MSSFVTVTSGQTVQAQDLNQVIAALNGTAGQGIPISLTAVNDSVNFALAVKNADPTNSRSLQVLRANNNVLIQADANGVIVSPDGGATTGQVLTVNATQTLTNKTLTSPHMTGPVVDSGGLTVTAGNVGVNVTAAAGAALAVRGTTADTTAYALQAQDSGAGNLLLVRNDGRITMGKAAGGGIQLLGLSAFVASDKYLVLDAAGNIHVSAVGPAS